MTFDNVRFKGCLQPSTLHISCTYCKASQYIQLRATHNDYSPSSTFPQCSDCFITSWGERTLIKDHFFQFNFLITRKHWCRWPDRWPIWQTTAWKLSRSFCIWHRLGYWPELGVEHGVYEGVDGGGEVTQPEGHLANPRRLPGVVVDHQDGLKLVFGFVFVFRHRWSGQFCQKLYLI